MKILGEFKEFAMRGNVIDLAIGVIMGAAFAPIVSTLVDNIVMPPIGYLLAGVDFSSLFINLSGTHYNSLAEAKAAGAATLNYGIFINNILDFVLVAFAVFLLVKQVNRFMPKPPAPAPADAKDCDYCKSSIPKAATRCPHCTSQLAAG